MRYRLAAVLLVGGLVACGQVADETESSAPATEEPVDEPTEAEAAAEDEPTEGEPAVEDEPTEGEPAAEDEPTTEYQLAVIATGNAAPSESEVAAFGDALDRAEPLCREDRGTIADMAVRGSQLAEENGFQAPILDLLLGISQAVPEEVAPMDCAEVLSSILVIMESG
jgi:hypothetical protein